MEGIQRAFDPLSADWVTGVLMSCLLILATINLGSPRKWRVLRQAAFRLRLGRQTLREEADANDRNLLGLQAVAMVSLALLLWQSCMALTGIVAPPFMYLAIAVGAALGAQSLLLRLIAWLARSDAGISEYLYTGSLLYIAVGVALLPLVALAAFRIGWREPLLWAGLMLLALALVYRWLRALVIGMGEGVNLRYILIYLCAAEILPLALACSALRRSLPPAPTI